MNIFWTFLLVCRYFTMVSQVSKPLWRFVNWIEFYTFCSTTNRVWSNSMSSNILTGRWDVDKALSTMFDCKRIKYADRSCMWWTTISWYMECVVKALEQYHVVSRMMKKTTMSTILRCDQVIVSWWIDDSKYDCIPWLKFTKTKYKIVLIVCFLYFLFLLIALKVCKKLGEMNAI